MHTVRCDSATGRVYAALGDGPGRGEYVSMDRGVTWRPILRGPRQGHTDCAVGERGVLWGSDDSLGRLTPGVRGGLAEGPSLVWERGYNVWFVVASGAQFYAGTYVKDLGRVRQAHLLGSNDGGRVWRRIISASHPAPGIQAFSSDSRRLSADGWLYFVAPDGRCYRVRRAGGG
jgi:hypothetical protein